MRLKNAKLMAMLMAAVMLTGALAGCSLSKNTAGSRRYMAFITKYNIYYNGDTHFTETLKEMEDKYEDDYTRLVFTHPVEAKNDPKAPQPTGNFDRSIEKSQKAIQIRSIKKKPKKKTGKNNDPEYKEWMRREEYNPFLHNSWMMMGRSQYYNGDFLGASATFLYISKHFSWLPETVTEAKLWEARSYCGMDWLFEAEVIISKIKPDELTNKTLKGLYNLTYGDYYVKSKEYDKAVGYLNEALKYASGTQKTRLNFLLGQVYSLLGKKAEAYQAFKRAGSSSSATYRTKFNARIKQSEVYTGKNIEPEVKALKRMTRYDRNAEYLDQIYYAIGNLYLSRKDTIKAIDNYKLAAEKSKRNGIDKAISQITLGQLYFQRHEYELAQPCFAEALPLLPDSYPEYQLLKRRSDVLDELAVYSQNVTLQDSLLRLSNMTPEQQEAVVKKIIDELKKKEKEEREAAAREEFLAQQAAQGNQLQNNKAPTTFNLNSDDSWYFYNTANRNAGKTEFQKRWGSRKLEDDWRRRNKASFDMNDFGSNNEDDDEAKEGEELAEGAEEQTPEDAEAAKRAEDPHFPEYYLKQIPKTDEERATANDIIQEGLYNMGVILKDKLEDYPASLSEFGRLNTRYPDNVYRLDAYYNIYLMYMREDKTAEAERYRNLIISEFPESKYGQALQDPNYIDNLRAMDQLQNELYDQALTAYFDNNNSAVHSIYERMVKQFPMSKLMPKFMFIDALTYVTDNRPEEFQQTLKEMLEKYPETDMTPLASSYLKQLNQGRKLLSGPSNTRGMLWDIHLGNDSTGTANREPAQFTLDPNSPQLLILTYPTDSVSGNLLLYEVARHNFSMFNVKDFELQQMNFGRLGMLIIKGFDNQRELDQYRRMFTSNPEFKLSRQVRPIIISASNFDILVKENRSLEEYFKFVEENNYRQAQENVLPPEVYGPAETIQEAEEAAKEIKADEKAQDKKSSKKKTGKKEQKKKPTKTKKTAEQPVEQPAEQPVEQPAEQPKKPAEQPKKPAKPVVSQPDFPVGSEGDDPLFDNP